MSQPVVWVISALQWPRACLRAELIERGFDAVGFAGLGAALASLEVTWPAAIALDLVDLPLSEDELSALAQAGIPVVLLGGAQETAPEGRRHGAWASILQRPFTIGQAADAVIAAAA